MESQKIGNGKKTKQITVIVCCCIAILIGILFYYLFINKNEYQSTFKKETVKETIKPYKFERFDEELLALDKDSTKIHEGLVNLKKKYGNFVDMYTIKILEIGPAETPGTAGYINQFLCHPAYHAFYLKVDSVFKDGLEDEEKKITLAFNRFHHFFPKKKMPNRLFTMFSGFYGNMAVDDKDNLAFGLEYYLGSDTTTFNHYYKWVDGIYEYQAPNLTRKKLPSDALLGWLMYQFPEQNENSVKLIDELIYQGKLLYASESMLPDFSDELLMGYSKAQIDWCKANEKQMWSRIKELKHLYTTDRLTISKYINPAPTTAYFPEDSPGKTGIWIGWQIVRSYMHHNKNVSLQQLMEMNDSQALLQASGYNPK